MRGFPSRCGWPCQTSPAHRPEHKHIVRRRAQQRGRIAWHLAQPHRPVCFIKHERHPIMIFRDSAGSLDRDDAIGAEDLTVLVPERLPQPRDRHRLAVAARDGIALAGLADRLLLVGTRPRARSPGAAETRRRTGDDRRRSPRAHGSAGVRCPGSPSHAATAPIAADRDGARASSDAAGSRDLAGQDRPPIRYRAHLDRRPTTVRQVSSSLSILSAHRKRDASGGCGHGFEASRTVIWRTVRTLFT